MRNLHILLFLEIFHLQDAECFVTVEEVASLILHEKSAPVQSVLNHFVERVLVAVSSMIQQLWEYFVSQ